MREHNAVATVAVAAPLQVLKVQTLSPGHSEVLVRVEWVASTPLDLHQSDGGLLVTYPRILGGGMAGEVVEAGKGSRLRKGDKVFGFSWRDPKEKSYQEYVLVPDYLTAKIPQNISAEQAATVPNNFVTAFHTLTKDCGFELPWPRPAQYEPPEAERPILLWGASSSVGQFILQVLRYYGYRKVLATSSQPHHEHLRTLGALEVFDYKKQGVSDSIYEKLHEYRIESSPLFIDCIGSKTGSLSVLSALAESGTRIAVMLPIVLEEHGSSKLPTYSMDAKNAVPWNSGVEVLGVRTHSYLENDFLKQNLQPIIMPRMLEDGNIIPTKVLVVEGSTMLERAEKALSILRNKGVSGERLVWKPI